MAECAGLLNRYRALKPYREFESHPLRHFKKPQFFAAFLFSSMRCKNFGVDPQSLGLTLQKNVACCKQRFNAVLKWWE